MDVYIYMKKLNNNLCPNKTAKEMDNYVDQINNSIILYGGRLPFIFLVKVLIIHLL